MTTTGPSLWASIPLPVFKPVRFIPHASEELIRDSEVSKVYVIGYSLDSEHTTGLGQTNHWAFCIQSSNDEWVTLDPIPSGIRGPKGGSKANIVVSHLQTKGLPRSVVHYNELQLQGKVTVGQLVDRIVDAGHHNYDFSTEGTGCKTWVVDQLDLLSDIISQSDILSVKKDIILGWPSGEPAPKTSGFGYYT